jgi:hypothetical protein
MRTLLATVLAVVAAVMLSSVPVDAQTKGGAAPAGGGGVKSKFYDFSDQLIDGDIKKPTTLYTDARQRVKFDRLLNLKKSFIQPMLQTAKEQTFK